MIQTKVEVVRKPENRVGKLKNQPDGVFVWGQSNTLYVKCMGKVITVDLDGNTKLYDVDDFTAEYTLVRTITATV